MINKKNFKLKLLALTMVLGIILLSITYYLAYAGNFYEELFWISVLSIGFSIFLLISEDISQNCIILCLFLFGTILYIMRILPSTDHFHFGDELAHFELLKLIYETGNLDIMPHFEVSRYYPGLELLSVSLKYITNIGIFPIVKILIGLIHSFLLVFLYLFFKEIGNSKRIAAIGSFIYATNPLYIFFDSLFSYESLGIFFVVILIYIISKRSFKGKSAISPIIAVVTMAGLVITHHFSAFMFLLFMIILYMIINIKKTHMSQFYQKWYSKFVFFTVIIVFGWLIYVAHIAISYIGNTFLNMFFKILELNRNTDIFSSSLSYALLPIYEYMIDTYIYVPLLLLLTIIGIYLIKKEYEANIFIYTVIIYGPVLYVLSLGLIPTSGSELAQRLWGFVYIGLSFVVAIALNKLFAKNDHNISRAYMIFSFFIILVILMAGISIGNKPVHREPDLLYPRLSAGSGGMTTDVYSSALWFETKFGRYNKMIGDQATGTVFTYYGIQDVDRISAWRAFYPDTIDDNVTDYLKAIVRTKYIIVDMRISKSLAELGYYFDQIEKDKFFPYYTYGYGRYRPLPEANINKFDNSDMLNEIYDNNNIKIYMIR